MKIKLETRIAEHVPFQLDWEGWSILRGRHSGHCEQRQHYNDVVARYEESRQAFPTNIVAGAFHFEPREYFRVDATAEREAPKVSFT